MPTFMDCECGGWRIGSCKACRANRLILAARDEALEEAAAVVSVMGRCHHSVASRIRALRSPQPRPTIDPDAVQVRDDSEADIRPTGCMYCVGMQFATGVGPNYCPKCGADRTK